MHNSNSQLNAEQQNGLATFPAPFQPRFFSLGAVFL
jgi:hypothetical protein